MTDKELLSYIQAIQRLMVEVATGSFYDEEKDQEYKNLYFRIKAALQARSMRHKNELSSLAEFHHYWNENLPTYRDRRYYVHQLYKEAEEDLYLNIESKPVSDDLFSISFEDLHEAVILRCKEDFEGEKYDDAVLKAFKLVEIRIREKGGFENGDYGRALMEKAFNPDLTPFSIEGDRGEVVGRLELFKGAIGAIKNPLSHRELGISKAESFQLLIFASLLLDFVDGLSLKESEDDGEVDIKDIPF